MPSLDELDRPRHWAEPEQPLGGERRGDDPTFQPIAPAWFSAMTQEQLADWPNRAARRWMMSRSWYLTLTIFVGSVAWGAGSSVAPVVGVMGMATSVVGIWLLTESLLSSDGEASYLSTWDGIENRYLIARRDRRQAYFALVVITSGFGLQTVGWFLAVR